MMNRPPFPEVVDSSMLAAFRSCPRKFELTYLQHWKPKTESIHLVAGKAFAAGLEETRRAFFIEGVDPELAIARGGRALLASYGDTVCPDDSAKSPERMLGALVFYFQRYGLETEAAVPISLPGGGRGIEFSFAEPLTICHPETGNPIIYSGRSDQIVDFAGGVYIEDDKTASQLGASWSKQWELRSQFTGYTWAGKYGAAHLPVQGVLVRGVSILKTKYDTLQAMTTRSDWEIDRWLKQVHRDLTRMIQMWDEGYFDYNLDHACTEYGGCAFTIVCKSPTPDDWLGMYFEPRKWDPLKREETLLHRLEEPA